MLGLWDEANLEEGLRRYIVTSITSIGSEASGASSSAGCPSGERGAVSGRPVSFINVALVEPGSTADWNIHLSGNLKDLGLAVRDKP